MVKILCAPFDRCLSPIKKYLKASVSFLTEILDRPSTLVLPGLASSSKTSSLVGYFPFFEEIRGSARRSESLLPEISKYEIAIE